MKVIKPTEFTAPILDSDLSGRDLKAEAYELVIEYCHTHGYLLLRKPRVRLSHETQMAHISAYIIPKQAA